MCAKNKIKNTKGAAKRFSYTGSGKIKRHQSSKGHLLTVKTKKRKRKLRRVATVDKADQKNIEKLLPNG